MKQIRTVKHSFNTTGTANYRIQLVGPLQLKITIIIIIIIILFSKKLTNKYTKQLGIFNWSSDYTVDRKKY